MFARFRQVRDRLNVSLVEAIRTGTKVRQTHVAGLGSIPLPPSPADRVRFWASASRRLGGLSNRLDDASREAIMAAIHARIPLPAGDDLEAAREATRNAGRAANAPLFAILRDKHRKLAEMHRKAAERETAAAEAVDGLETTHASLPMTPAEIRRFLKSLGWTDADLRHGRDLNALCQQFGEDQIIPKLARESVEAGDRYSRRTARQLAALIRRRGRRAIIRFSDSLEPAFCEQFTSERRVIRSEFMQRGGPLVGEGAGRVNENQPTFQVASVPFLVCPSLSYCKICRPDQNRALTD